MQEKLLIANWKSHKTKAECDTWFTTFSKKISPDLLQTSHLKIIIAPSSLYLDLTVSFFKDYFGISIAAQDVSQFPLGAYTGAVAAQQLTSIGVKYAIVGHSERRRYFGDTHQIVAQKVELLLDNAITPIVCVDENEIQQQADLISKERCEQCVFAYEPVSSIGTGMGQDIAAVKNVISFAKQAFGETTVLYGGSVDERNIHEYLFASDGALIGGASLDAEVFSRLILSASSKED